MDTDTRAANRGRRQKGGTVMPTLRTFLLLSAVGASMISAPAQPVISVPPTNQVVLVGTTAALTVGVSGTGPFTYQWLHEGTNLPHYYGTNAFYTPGVIMSVAGNQNALTLGDGGPATNALLSHPADMAVDAMGNILIADESNNRIRKVNTNGIITTFAGGGFTGLGDGGPATNAVLNFPNSVAIDAAGNLFIADTRNNRVRRIGADGIINTFAGTNGAGLGGDGGAATNARLNGPFGLALDRMGNIGIADTGNSRIRTVDTNGIITTLAGTTAGFFGDGGAGTNAGLSSPFGVTFDNAGNCFIADSMNNRIRKIDSAGVITTIAGTNVAGFSGDGGPAVNAALNQPWGIVCDDYGDVFFSDVNNLRVRMITPAGQISTIAGSGVSGSSGVGPAIATNVILFNPAGLRFDNTGQLLIASARAAGTIRRLDLWRSPNLNLSNVTWNDGGDYQVVITTPSGSVTSSIVTVTVIGVIAQPASVVVSAGSPASFTFGVSDPELLDFQWCFNGAPLAGATNATLSIAGVSSNDAGDYSCIAGNGSLSLTSRVATLSIGLPPQVAVQPTNEVIIGGSNTTMTVSISGTGPFTYQWQLNGTNLPNNLITTIAGGGSSFGDGGPAVNAVLSSPNGAVTDPRGNVFVVDKQNNRIRKIDANGIITTIVGSGLQGFSGDGGRATNAALSQPLDVCVDTAGNLYIADSNNHRVRRVDTNGTITTVAGSGATGSFGGAFAGDGGFATNARFNGPAGVFVDAVGNLFIADRFNHRIRRVDPNGILTTVAGIGPGSGMFGGGYNGDGIPAANAMLNGPDAVVEDNAGRLFISDRDNDRVRMVDTNGLIATIAGNGGGGYSGDGPATGGEIDAVGGVTFFGGNVFLAGSSIQRILEVDTNGMMRTVGGNGNGGFFGDGGAATNAMMFFPQRIFADGAGNLFFGDQFNNRIRKIALGGLPTLLINNAGLTNAGNYSVVITSPYGSVTSSIASLLVVLKPQQFAPAFDGTTLRLQFAGTPNYPYVLQSATNLTPPVIWQSVITNMTDTDGNWSYTETNFHLMPQRFYRAGP